MKKRNLLAILLILSLLFASCVASDGTNDTPIDTLSDDTVISGKEGIDDGLDEYNGAFVGYEFRVEASEDNWRYVDIEDNMSDIVDQTVYRRNLAVEERFGCDIVIAYNDAKWENCRDYITRTVLSGEDLFDLAYHHAVSLGLIASSDYLLNWYDVPNVDFDKPWWSDSTVNNLSYDDKCFVAIGDYALTAFSNAYCVYYNKNDADIYGLPNLYEVVKNGDWTLDYMLELAAEIYVDSNRNNTVDDDDYFGYVSDSMSCMNAYLWAFDNPILKNTDQGIEVSFKTEKISDIVTRLVNLTQSGSIRTNTKYKNSTNGGAFDYGIEMFAKGNALFANGYIAQSLIHLRDMSDNYGILPYPKWDENQENYYTMADGNHAALGIPKTVSEDRLEFVGVIVEALCAESYKTLKPVYYEEALKLKGTRDDESIEMMDLITDSIIYDMGYIYDGFNGCSFYVQNLVLSGNPNFESYYAANSGKALTWYDTVIEYFEDYSN